LPIFDLPYPTHLSQRQHWPPLAGAAQALAISEAVKKSGRFCLLLTEGSASAERLSEELRFFAQELPVLHFPDWETLPYDVFSPHQDIISQRLATLYRLPQTQSGVLVVPIATALQRLAPPSFLLGQSLLLDVGQKFDRETMRLRLAAAGYRQVDSVYEHGEFAVRGAILDLFPMGSRLPLRIDLFDDEIESLRRFDPQTQRTLDKVEKIELLPAREFALDKDSINAFRKRFRERFAVDLQRCPLYQDISSGLIPAGIEYWLPLFFEQSASLFDYLPEHTQVFLLPALMPAAEQFWADAKNRYQEYGVDRTRPLLTPAELFLPVEDCFARLKRWPQIHLTTADTSALPDVAIEAKAREPLAKLRRFIEDYPGRVLFCAESAGRREALLAQLSRIQLKPKEVAGWAQFTQSSEPLCICIAALEQSLLTEQVALISESALFGKQVMQRRRRTRGQASGDAVIKNLSELSIGAPVVHIDHGVGRYLGLVSMEFDGQSAEFLALQYAGDAKLYVPVASLHLIARYAGSDADSAPLHRLGSEQWQKAKRKAAQQVRDVAAELLDTYARRAAREGFAFSDPTADYAAFAADFPFEETADQQAAIEAVRADMLSAKPMDRLICGDVGFGKTEVAMRAAFIAVHSGKQVAVLVPTTLLAQQHYNSFRDRFADWPVAIEVMSRFKSAKDLAEVSQQLEGGKIDILIGTHKLLQGDVRFPNLGLVIIDEEHRFGVRQKEQLKALRSEVDILTLTATPIPRTLNMAVAGMRDLSIIATAPARRLSVRTFVLQSNPATIKEALLRELLRGGQVYYLHNEVKSIEKCAADLTELVAEARIGIAHGQLRERELEQVMSDFYHKRFNVLVTSTIIETGIDIPSANTIIIDRADKFGLAQLHQLRGRVGRSHHQAYAYLLTPPPKQMTDDAKRRLDAIAGAQDLGAGFILATHDLEIRGAGELLGEGQSGQIQAVGFTLYMEMLERAIKAIQKGEQPNLEQPLAHGTEINLHLSALIPEDYLPDVQARLILYKRIASAENLAALDELQVEMIDRFGLLPPPARNLLRVTALKLLAEPLGIDKIDCTANGARIDFATSTQVDPLKLITLVQSAPKQYRFETPSRLKLDIPMERIEERFATLEALLERLSQ